jgi:F-type H+-transporting ATPase subunit delta
MSDLAIARRYASALYAEADSTDSIDRVDADIDLLTQTVSESRDLRLLFASPVVSASKKETIIRKLFEPHVSDLVLSFLMLVNRKRRASIVEAILDSYRSLRLEHQGIVEAKARVAIKMTDADVEELRKSIAKTVGSDVHLEVEEDSDLIGGIVVKIGDRVYDGSLKRQLAKLKRQLQGGSLHTN